MRAPPIKTSLPLRTLGWGLCLWGSYGLSGCIDKFNVGMLHDAAVSADQGHTPQQDAGEPSQDAGRPQQDASGPSQDGGTPSQDAGRPQQDVGVPEQDGGEPDAGDAGQDAGGPRLDAELPDDMGPPDSEVLPEALSCWNLAEHLLICLCEDGWCAEGRSPDIDRLPECIDQVSEDAQLDGNDERLRLLQDLGACSADRCVGRGGYPCIEEYCTRSLWPCITQGLPDGPAQCQEPEGCCRTYQTCRDICGSEGGASSEECLQACAREAPYAGYDHYWKGVQWCTSLVPTGDSPEAECNPCSWHGGSVVDF